MGWWYIARKWYYQSFNIKFAAISAIFNGGVVMVINSRQTLTMALGAGLTQAVSSFFSTGVMARIVQHFSPIHSPIRSYLWGSMIPATLTFTISYGAHLANNTSGPLINATPATLVSFGTSFITN